MRKIVVHLVPNAKTTEIVGKMGLAWKIRVAAPALEGKANTELIRYLADVLDVAKSEITILKGQASKIKTVGIPDRVSLDDIVDD